MAPALVKSWQLPAILLFLRLHLTRRVVETAEVRQLLLRTVVLFEETATMISSLSICPPAILLTLHLVVATHLCALLDHRCICSRTVWHWYECRVLESVPRYNRERHSILQHLQLYIRQ
jgi:hypothetical protein